MAKLSVFIATIAVLMLLIPSQLTVLAASPRHCKGFDYYFYASDDQAFAALMAGEVDFINWPLTYEQYLEACATPPYLQFAGYTRNDMTEFDVNNNYTIADYPSVRNPLNDVEFRRALAEATDKDYIIHDILKDFVERIDCPLCAPQKGYGDENCCKPEAHPFNLTLANARLDTAGFDDYDLDGWRNYPLDWDGVAGEIGVRDEPNIDCLKFYVRVDHSDRVAAANIFASTIQDDLLIPVCLVYTTGLIILEVVMGARNYHIYIGGWSLGRYPTYLWNLFHSDNWYPYGSNYVTGMNKTNEPNYPDLDAVLEEIYYATDMTTFTAAVKNATRLLACIYYVNIPLWSYRSWMAYSKYLVGIVNMDGYGIDNMYTYLNAYKVDSPTTPGDESQEPIKVGIVNAPSSLNILYSTDDSAKAFFDKISGHLLSLNPYNLAIDQPWIAQDWYETTWFDPQDGENKTKVTYYIRKDVWWHAPLTGEAVQKFTAHDVEFSIWYLYNFSDSPYWSCVKDVHHTKIVDDFTIEVYFGSLSMFHKYAIGLDMPFLKKHALLDLLCEPSMCELPIVEPRVPSDKDRLSCPSIVQIINATKYPEGQPLIEGVDYEVFATGAPDYCHNEIHWLRPLDLGEWVVFWYWTPDLDPHGYYLANLPWQQTMYSTGLYYVVDISPSVGGWAILNCVDSHWLGAPPLGEIDWTWYWVAGPYPRSGYYQVNLYDAVALLKAYCARGDTCPIPTNWFPGADIDPYDLCHVGLYDAVQLLTNYGKKFGIPPLEDP